MRAGSTMEVWVPAVTSGIARAVSLTAARPRTSAADPARVNANRFAHGNV
jgi:hypothetical protein